MMILDDDICYDEEGEDDPEYNRPSEAEGWRRICTGIVAFLLVMFVGFAVAIAVVSLADHIGGPVE